MIVYSSAPSRLSLLGGGTDVPAYADIYGGEVLSIAINLRTHVKLYLDSNLHEIFTNHLPTNADPELFYSIRDHFGVNSMHFSLVDSSFDGFIKSGLGSSASASVALIGALNKAQKKGMTRGEISELAWKIEVEKLGWYGGRQDQNASVFGGGNYFKFSDKKVEVMPLSQTNIWRLCDYIQLFYIGGMRESSKIQNGFKKLDKRQIEKLDQIKELVIQGVFALQKNQFKRFGQLLNETWKLKKSSNKGVSSEKIDKLYKLAMKNKAWGAKICGAGGCGYMITISDIKNKEGIENAFKSEGIRKVDFEPDFHGLSTRIL